MEELFCNHFCLISVKPLIPLTIKILLYRLHVLAGEFGCALDLFTSYFSDRTLSVRTNKFTSNTSSLTCGVKRGFWVHFFFCMLPLAAIIQFFNYIFFYHFYADDIQLDRLSTLVHSLTQKEY